MTRPPLTPAQRSMAARAAAYALHAQRDGQVITAPARARFLAKFEAAVDPDSVLSPEERKRRATFALKSHMARISLRRSRKAAATKARKAAQ